MFALDLPFLFRDHDHADKVLEGELGEYILKGLEQNSAVRGLAFTYSGGYRIIPANKELATVEAFKGTKIRTSRSPVAIDTFKALGADVNSKVELEEMNQAADEGIIEAGESTFVRVIPLKQNESFEYVNDTAHSLFLTSIIIATKFWDTLSSEVQQIMKDAALDAARLERKESVEQIPEIIENCKANNVPVISMSEDETLKFKNLTAHLYEKYRNYFTIDLISKIQKI
jgi:TRAP-type C4-dicarboxylate transport system substrate-binding protein